MFRKKDNHEHDWAVIGTSYFTDPDYKNSNELMINGKARTGILYKCLGCGESEQRSYGGHLRKSTMDKLSKKPCRPW